MFVELHLLQNFAPSNLNRDDTGAPKDCEFGGYRRARISSQCLKRAVREEFKAQALLPAEHLASRTKRVATALAERLAERGKPEEDAQLVAGSLIATIKSNLYDPKLQKTQYLMFLGQQEIDRAAALCEEYWDKLLAAAPGAEATDGGDGAAPSKPKGTPKGRKGAGAEQSIVPPAVKTALQRSLDGGRAADLALFGRMLADLPERNIDAACQVAHAISTNKVSMEMDFYTAVDDLKPDDTAGADMLGTVEFNSACFYRYANVDLRQLKKNLGGDEALARTTLDAFLRGSVAAVPTGKQNSMAAQNPPSFCLAVVRRGGLWNLANAFLSPVWPPRDGDLVHSSIGRLDEYWGKLTRMYGESTIAGRWACTLENDGLQRLADARVDDVETLVARVLDAASFAEPPTNGLR